MDSIDNIKKKEERTNKHSFFTFFVFLAISTAAWFLVKLSEDYTTQTVFKVQFEDVPADLWVSSGDQSVKLSMNVDGFHILRYKMIPEQRRVVTIPLDEVPYHQEKANVYSFSSQYVVEEVAEWMKINASEITINEDKVYFSMDPLKSKVVPIVLRHSIKPQRQFGIYGIPMLDPASVTIYGPEEIIDTVRTVSTMSLSKSNVGKGFSEVIGLDLMGGKIRSNTKEVKVTVEVERFTEMDIEVPVRVPNGMKLRLFPENITVKCHVAMKDYANITPDAFSVTVDEKQLQALQPLLDVHLISWPPTVQILNASPDKVEYLIVQ